MEWKKETLQSFLKLNKERLIFIFCSGLLLFLLAWPADGGSQKTSAGSTGEDWTMLEGIGTTSGVQAGVLTGSVDETGLTAYELQLESRVRSLLQGVEGVGEVDVMVMLKPQEQTTMFEEDDSETVLGVIISADGGGSAVVKTEISEAMEALFGLPPHKIKVLKRVKKGV